MRETSTVAILAWVLLGGCAAPRPPAVAPSEAWLSTVRRDIASRFRLADSTVRVSWTRPSEDTIPVLEVRFDEIATNRLGYFQGDFPTERVLEAAWRHVPAALSVRGLLVTLRDIDGYGSFLTPADSLDRHWPRRR